MNLWARTELIYSRVALQYNSTGTYLSIGTSTKLVCEYSCICSVHVSDEHQNKYTYICTIVLLAVQCVALVPVSSLSVITIIHK